MQINGLGGSQSSDMRYMNNRTQYQNSSDKAADTEEAVILTLSSMAKEETKKSAVSSQDTQEEVSISDWFQQLIERIKSFLSKIWNEDSTRKADLAKESSENIAMVESHQEGNGQLEESHHLEESTQVEERRHLRERNQVEESHHLKERNQLEESHHLKESTPVEESHHLKERNQLEESRHLEEGTPVEESHHLKESTPVEESIHLEENTPVEESRHLEENTPVEEHSREEEGAAIKETNRQEKSVGLLSPLVEIIKHFLANPFSDEELVSKKQEPLKGKQEPAKEQQGRSSFETYAAANGLNNAEVAHQMQVKSQLWDTYNSKGEHSQLVREVPSNLSIRK